MTAKQRAARAKFKAVVAEAKKLRKKNPKLTQAQAVKQAFAISYSKQRAGIGAKSVKVKGNKRKGTEMHTDTKSHNVNIRVVSGWKKGKTKFVEKGEKRPKRNAILVKRSSGAFSSFKRIAGVGKMNDSKQLSQIAAENKLKSAVIRILKDKVKDYKGDYKTLFEEILQYGLQSGIINELVYYDDTKAWFKKYNTEISRLLKDTMYELGANSPSQVFGNKWDETDPFASETNNQNLLAWFSFEETTREIANRLGYEI